MRARRSVTCTFFWALLTLSALLIVLVQAEKHEIDKDNSADTVIIRSSSDYDSVIEVWQDSKIISRTQVSRVVVVDGDSVYRLGGDNRQDRFGQVGNRYDSQRPRALEYLQNEMAAVTMALSSKGGLIAAIIPLVFGLIAGTVVVLVCIGLADMIASAIILRQAHMQAEIEDSVLPVNEKDKYILHQQ
ncbi:hypothetical protein V1511DRAFT_509744 [Dipodascopsis uninucleata]